MLSDNATRWNCAYRMVERLINRKDAVNEVLSDKKCDMLLFVSELQSLEEMVELLKYFAVQTGNLSVVVI